MIEITNDKQIKKIKRNERFMAQGGVYKKVKSVLGEGVIKIEKPNKSLAKIEEEFKYKLPLIPRELFDKSMGFFKWAYDKHQAEATISLYRNAVNGAFKIEVPTQKVSGASIETEGGYANDGDYKFIGTFHSHNTMGAFFSGIDDDDDLENTPSGVHIVVGTLTTTPTFVARVVAQGREFPLEVYEVFDLNGDESFPNEWKDKVTKMHSQVFRYGKGRGGKNSNSEYREYNDGLDDSDYWSQYFKGGTMSRYQYEEFLGLDLDSLLQNNPENYEIGTYFIHDKINDINIEKEKAV